MVDRVLESFERKFDRSPTIAEIVDATGLSAEMVLQTMESRTS
jgi:DNA-directed RNA polymerase specialized sigma subunit